MAKNHCPSCERPNALSARFCNACGAVLRVRCPHCAAQNDATRSACGECGGTMKAAAKRPRPAAAGGLKIVLLDVGDVPPAPDLFAPQKPELVRSDPDPPVRAPAAPDDRLDLPPADAKTARRAAVRRAVIARGPREEATPAGTVEVLVFDDDESTRTPLRDLLESFGFCVRTAQSHAEVTALLERHTMAAAFLQVVLDGTGSSVDAELCRIVKRPDAASGRAAALIVVANEARPSDRVRATMAGADEFLVKPLGRGDVVRALENCVIPLPSDPRRR